MKKKAEDKLTFLNVLENFIYTHLYTLNKDRLNKDAHLA